MRIRFWGVRGSLPAPQLPSQIRSKISAVLERVTPEDIESAASRERFLAGLPPWLFGTIGGNTPCVSVHFDDSPEVVIFDTGSGVRNLGIAMAGKSPKPGKYHIFYSHFHWDHLCGLPFFNPAYDPSVDIHFYSPKEHLEEVLCGQMAPPYFPVRMETMGSKKTYHLLEGAITLNGARYSYKKLNHPGDSYSYRIDDGKHRFIFATDTELNARDFVKDAGNSAYFQDADVAVIDSQYTLGEAIEKYNWGHSAFSLAVDFAATWNIKHLVLFHHDPGYDDRKLYNILQSARLYMERMNITGLRISLAMEGMEIAL
jgi:phosphoribosyl 1,2-cyclic phosphodiesterase